MTTRSSTTRQVNLTLTASQEQIVRLLVRRLREGGLEYEARVRSFVTEPPIPKYMHIADLDRRFGAIERRLIQLEQSLFGDAERVTLDGMAATENDSAVEDVATMGATDGQS